MTAPAKVLRLGAGALVVVDSGGRLVAGALDTTGYVIDRYPDLHSILDALAAHGWSHQWARDDLILLHRCGAGKFVILEEDDRNRDWDVSELVSAVIDAHGTYTDAPSP